MKAGKKLLIGIVVLSLVIACMQPACALPSNIRVSVDKSKLYPTTIWVDGSESMKVWSGYITVTVTYQDGSPVSTRVKAMSKGELVSSVQATNSNGVAVLPVLTDSPPPLIRIWVKNPSPPYNWFDPSPAPSVIDPEEGPKALGGGGGSGDAVSPMSVLIFFAFAVIYLGFGGAQDSLEHVRRRRR